MVLSFTATTITTPFSHPSGRDLAVDYLMAHYNTQLHLIYESEDRGPQWFTGTGMVSGTYAHDETYWVYSDNLFAYLALQEYQPATSMMIWYTLDGYHLNEGNYGSINGETFSSFNQTKTITLYHDSYDIVLANVANGAMISLNLQYADMAVYYALNEYEKGYVTIARSVLQSTFNMWNGTCVVDVATLAPQSFMNREYTNAGFCTNYKVGLILFAAKVLGLTPPAGMESYLWSMQIYNGGIASLSRNGKPYGSANTETTSIALLQFNMLLVFRLQPPVLNVMEVQP